MSYRIIPPHHVAEITLSVEQGLLLPANPLMKVLILAAMARAQYLHPLIICHYLVESTHIHFMVLIKDPTVVRDFMERFKTETAHYINRMLGRKKRTVWCESYSCMPILTESSARSKISYIYNNPAKDGLEDSIEQYPGLSSWKAYQSGKHSIRVPRVFRSIIPYMPEGFYTEHQYRCEVKKLKKLSSKEHTLRLSPDAWMEAFGEYTEEARKEQNELTLALIKIEEAQFRRMREAGGKSVIGKEALRAAHLETQYLSKNRDGKKMWCISDDKDLRIRYIQWAKSIKQRARDVYERWKVGDFTLPFPPGVFTPTRPMLANMSPLALEY
jgi:REP element-mobilizing transposase RayT